MIQFYIYKYKKNDADMYIWKDYIDYMTMQNKIRNMYNSHFFIFSQSFTKNGLFVTLNGIVLKDTTDYSATTGNTITLTFNAAANDEVNIYAFNSIGIANTYTITQADAKFTTAGKALAMNFFRS